MPPGHPSPFQAMVKGCFRTNVPILARQRNFGLEGGQPLKRGPPRSLAVKISLNYFETLNK
ncbi:MAG: hypothetical protein A2Y79_02070 [Deltaproteobacteria bacterium RBG_13_43_22]|nr:MAG: hypothetical protein A2Y79_02070 [Deltaproteobacteria bacterium RBG_13_43_22]